MHLATLLEPLLGAEKQIDHNTRYELCEEDTHHKLEEDEADIDCRVEGPGVHVIHHAVPTLANKYLLNALRTRKGSVRGARST